MAPIGIESKIGVSMAKTTGEPFPKRTKNLFFLVKIFLTLLLSERFTKKLTINKSKSIPEK